MRKALAAALLLAAGPAAADPPGYLDVYYLPSAELESTIPGIGRDKRSGDGFGVKGMAPLAETGVMTGEYQTVTYDEGGDFDQIRIGAGVMGRRGGGALLEFIKMESGQSATDGFGVHLRFGGRQFYSQVGYLSLKDGFEDHTGYEFAIGIALTGRDRNGLFVDYRRTVLEGQENDIEDKLSDIRAGVRMGFGGRSRGDD